MKDGYRIEQMAPQPEELVGVVEPLDAGWVMVRNHDDEPMSIYDTREQAEAALREANSSLDRHQSNQKEGRIHDA